MKGYRCYLRAVILSVIAAFLIDAAINFEEYKQSWAANFRSEEELVNTGSKPSLPSVIGKVTTNILAKYP